MQILDDEFFNTEMLTLSKSGAPVQLTQIKPKVCSPPPSSHNNSTPSLKSLSKSSKSSLLVCSEDIHFNLVGDFDQNLRKEIDADE